MRREEGEGEDGDEAAEEDEEEDAFAPVETARLGVSSLLLLLLLMEWMRASSAAKS